MSSEPLRHSWFRAAALVAILVVIVSTACWLARQWAIYAEEQRAVEELSAQGSLIWSLDEESRLTEKLPMLGAPRYFTMCVDHANIDLRPARSLRVLNLSLGDGTTLSEESAQVLGELTHVSILSMRRARVPPETWGHVGRTKKVWLLNLTDVEVGDEGAAQLASLSSLSQLSLEACGVTDEGLAHLSRLTGLRKLAVRKSRITAAGVAHLKGLPNLENLELSSCGLDDEALEAAATLPSLYWLDVSGNPITDKGLQAFQNRPEGVSLRAHATLMTEAGIAQVRQDNPAVIVNLEPEP